MARAAFKCIGGPFEFKLGGWSGLLPAVIAGQADVMWDNLYYTAERAKQVDYVVYMVAGTGGLVEKGNPKKITAMDGRCGLTATAGLGTVEEAAFRDQSKKCGGRQDGDQHRDLSRHSGRHPPHPERSRRYPADDLALVDQLVRQQPDVFERGFKISATSRSASP